MPQTVKQLLDDIKKGAITTATGGLMSAENAQRFINTVRDENPLFKNEIEVLTVGGDSRTIDTLGLAARVMRKATEGVAPGDPVGATIGRHTLTPVEVILPYDVSLSWLEDNIEGEDADALLRRAFATQFGNDSLDVGINGDTADLDAFIQILDGWIKQIANDGNTHLYSPTDATKFADDVFPGLLSALPNKWRANKQGLSIYLSPNDEESYRKELRSRGTALGDAVLTGSRPVSFSGIDVVPVSWWPDGKPVLMPKKNLKVGYKRNISTAKQAQPRKRIMEYTITARFDAKYAVSDAISYVA